MKKIKFKIILLLLLILLIIMGKNTVLAKYIFETNEILIVETYLDRTPPKLDISYSTKDITNGDVLVTIKCNEKIKNIDGWSISEDKQTLTKIYETNKTEEIEVSDLAGNKTIVTVNVTGATYISLIYASHNSNVGWTYGYGNYDIAGREAIKENPIYKTEALAFNVNGNISKDFVKGRAYVYSYWGEGSKALCTGSKMAYSYGYNPSPADWKTMNSGDLVTIEGKKYFQFRRRRNKW